MGNRIDAIKTHFTKHKTIYITIAATAVVSIAGTLLIVRYGQISSKVTQQAILTWKPILEQNTNVIIQAPGNSGNILQDDLGNLYPSQNAASKVLGVDPKAIYDHLKGRSEDVGGRVLTKILDGSPQHSLVGS